MVLVNYVKVTMSSSYILERQVGPSTLELANTSEISKELTLDLGLMVLKVRKD